MNEAQLLSDADVRDHAIAEVSGERLCLWCGMPLAEAAITSCPDAFTEENRTITIEVDEP